MICRTCGRALDPGTRFCPACGTPVEATCARCGVNLAADARFCPACGTAVVPPPHPPVGDPSEPARERRVATMLFADLVGFTSLGEAHDPEVVSGVVRDVFERLGEEIRRYEGTIEKFVGDAMLAVFGVPTIHEDDPERAVRAALEMQAALELTGADGPGGLRPRLRIGLDTGEVLVDLDRASGSRDLFVTGDAVNTAARLQGAAEPGTVIVGAATYAATRDVVEYEELPPVALKGKSDLVAAWRAVTVKARRGGVRSPLGIEAPLVGRGEELELLKETMRRAVASARPRMVTVVGAAGVGKSRLTWELEKYIDGLPETFHWRKGRCLSYAQASYSALADVIKADIRAADDEAPSIVVEKLDARLTQLDPAGASGIRRALLATLGLESEAVPRDGLVDGWVRYLGLVAAAEPLILVLEDIHWADEGLLDFVEYLSRWGEGPITIICLARHELFDRRATWGGGISNAATVMLEPLTPDETASLLDGLLAGGLPVALRERVVGLAAGNPLFAEELIRMFVDRGVLRLGDGTWELARPMEEVEVPSSVQAVLAARLDGLPSDEKRLAQNAAVIGRIFWDILLAHLSRMGAGATGDLLRRLRVKELVVPRQPSSLVGASEFGFRHVLVRDVAYDSLPKRDRAMLHADVADWAEAALADRIDEFSELVAGHRAAALAYESELAGSPDASSLRGLRELTYLAAVRAARRAASVSALPAAQRWQTLAIEQARRLEAPARERIGLASDFYAYLWHEAKPAERIAVFSEAIDAFGRPADATDGDRQRLAKLQAALGEARFEANEIEAAQAGLREGIAAFETEAPSEGRSSLLRVLGWSLWRTGSPGEAEPILERAVADARATASDDALRWAIHDLGIVRTRTGRIDEGIDLVEQSFEMARGSGDRALMGRCYINLPNLLEQRGDSWTATVPLLEEGLAQARRDGATATICWLAENLGFQLEDLGRLDDEAALATEAIEAARRAGDDYLTASGYVLLAWAQLARGERDLAHAARDAGPSASTRVEADLGYVAILDAALRWADDPMRAFDELSVLLEGQGLASHVRPAAGRWLARMALRLDDRGGLMRGCTAFLEGSADQPGPVRVMQRRWMEGLAGHPDGGEVEAAAEELEASGYRRVAVDAFADAALMAARAGRATAAERRATSVAAEIGYQPFLGSPPETRWVQPRPTMPS